MLAIDRHGVVHLRVGIARAQCLNSNIRAETVQFQVKSLRERCHPALRRAITGAAWSPYPCRNRSNVDHGTGIPRHHVAESSVGEPHGRHNVQFMHFLLTDQWRLPEPALRAESRVVDKQNETLLVPDSFGSSP